MNYPALRGPRILLEPWQITHRDLLYQAAQDASIRTYTLGQTKNLPESFNNWFNTAVTACQQPRHQVYVVTQLSTQKLVAAAVKKRGAQEEDSLLQHVILADGYVRDAVIYSIIHSEWPDVRLKLQQRIAA